MYSVTLRQNNNIRHFVQNGIIPAPSIGLDWTGMWAVYFAFYVNHAVIFTISIKLYFHILNTMKKNTID